METLGNSIIELLETDKNFLLVMKKATINSGDYGLGAELRQIEIDKFPDSEEDKDIKQQVNDLILAMKMVEVKCNEHAAFRFLMVMKQENMNDFSLKDAARIIAKGRELFGDD